MPILSSLILLALQVGPNPAAVPLPNGHDELRDRPDRQTDDVATSPASAWLAQCLALVAEDPARAHTLAQVKRNESTGAERVLANHCLGLAATELTLWEDAITAFAAARDDTPADEPRVRARFGAMAGSAALVSGDAMRAETILRRAKTEAGEAASASLQAVASVDLARALVAQDQPDPALAELDHAARLQPDDPETWLLKATLLRRLNRLDEAQSAIERAGELSPADAQIGLEAGVIAVLSGRDEAARASWESVIELQPGSLAAQIAQDYLAQLVPPANTPDQESETQSAS